MSDPRSSRPPALGSLLGVWVLSLLASACGGQVAEAVPIPAHLDAPSVTSVLLLGDGGVMAPDDPIRALVAMDASASAELGPTVVVFLGDNVYPSGVRASEPEYSQDTATLALQADLVSGSGAEAVFVPGNHDWDEGSEDGLMALDRQAAWISATRNRGVDVRVAPQPGCPGPEVLDVGSVRLVVLDTQWFIHGHVRRCEAVSRAEILSAVTSAVDEAGDREVMVVGHHPLRTHGPHGGYFPADRHLFPLRDIWPRAFVPLPLLGTAYVASRAWGGITDQDLSGAGNQRMRAGILEAIRAADRAPVVYAAGHEHSLQVIRGERGEPAYHLVSGAASKTTPVNAGRGTLFATSQRGYLKVEVGPRHLQVAAVVNRVSEPGAPKGWCLRIDRASRAETPC